MDIEEDIKLLKKFNPGDEHTERIKEAIENILAERQADKKKIKELEEENRLQRSQLNSAFNNGFIQKQKVKDKMEKLNKEIKNSDEIEAIFKIKQQQILQDLLEDK